MTQKKIVTSGTLFSIRRARTLLRAAVDERAVAPGLVLMRAGSARPPDSRLNTHRPAQSTRSMAGQVQDEAAAGPVAEGHVAPARAREPPRQRQPQSRAAVVLPVAAHSGIERPLAERDRHARPVVAHRHPHAAARRAEHELDPAARHGDARSPAAAPAPGAPPRRRPRRAAAARAPGRRRPRRPPPARSPRGPPTPPSDRSRAARRRAARRSPASGGRPRPRPTPAPPPAPRPRRGPARSASSARARIRAIGVRSSCAISLANRCSWRREAAIRPSRLSSVAASPVSSSRRGPRSKRWSRSFALHAAASRVIAATGRSAPSTAPRIASHPASRRSPASTSEPSRT